MFHATRARAGLSILSKKALFEMPIIINKEECEGCGTCTPVCPNSAIALKEVDGSIVAEVVSDLCNECCECMEFCLRGAIKEV